MEEKEIVTRLEKISNDLEEAAVSCIKGLLRTEEAIGVFNLAMVGTGSVLEKDSVPFRLFDRARKEKTPWWPVTKSGYVNAEDSKMFENLNKVVREIIDYYSPEFLREESIKKNQYFLPDGDPYRAKKIVYSLLKKAGDSLIIIDEYLDETIFDYIESIDKKVKVKLITGNRKPIFPVLYNDLRTKRGNLEAKLCEKCHDRYLIIDNSAIWQLGCSINGLGGKASTLIEMTDVAEKEKFSTSFNKWWDEGVSL